MYRIRDPRPKDRETNATPTPDHPSRVRRTWPWRCCRDRLQHVAPDAGKSSSIASKASTAADAAGTVLSQNTLPAASAIANDVAKRKSVAITKCAASDGGWTASGTAKNSGTGDATYAITIFFTNAHATVQDYATTSVTVKAGQSADWTASKKFTASTPTNCVLRGVG